MKITFNIEQSNANETIYIKDNAVEYEILDGDTIDIYSNFITLYTKTYVQLSILSKIVLFIKRLIINIFNVLVMNYPTKWYKNAEPYILKPITIDLGKVSKNNLRIKMVCSKIDIANKTIQKRELYIENKLVSPEVAYHKEGIDLLFLKYIYDMFSLLIYACSLISLVFGFSGKLGQTIIVAAYSIIMVGLCVPILYKCICAYKEKKDFEKWAQKYEV